MTQRSSWFGPLSKEHSCGTTRLGAEPAEPEPLHQLRRDDAVREGEREEGWLIATPSCTDIRGGHKGGLSPQLKVPILKKVSSELLTIADRLREHGFVSVDESLRSVDRRLFNRRGPPDCADGDNRNCNRRSHHHSRSVRHDRLLRYGDMTGAP